MYRAGQLRSPVTLLRSTVVQDASGADVETWVTEAQVRAYVSEAPYRPSERFNRTVRQTISVQSVAVVIRWRAGVSTRWRVQTSDSLYDVENVIDPEGGKRRWLKLMCSEVQS